MKNRRTFSDLVLLGVWTFGYAAIVRVFRLMRRMEAGRGARDAKGAA